MILENGLTAGNTLVYDTICDGAGYRITGNEPVTDEPVIYTWYASKDRGQTWEWLEGQTRKDLELKNMVQDVPFSTAVELRYKRYFSTVNGSGISGTSGIDRGTWVYNQSVVRHADSLPGRLVVLKSARLYLLILNGSWSIGEERFRLPKRTLFIVFVSR